MITFFMMRRCEPNIRYVNKRAREKQAQLEIYEQEFCWPDSFPNCTKKLGMSVFHLKIYMCHFILITYISIFFVVVLMLMLFFIVTEEHLKNIHLFSFEISFL